jgi:hypothetical protein
MAAAGAIFEAVDASEALRIISAEHPVLSERRAAGLPGAALAAALRRRQGRSDLGRQLRPKGRDVYGLFAAQVVEGERRPTAKLFDVPSPASTKTGRLHLRRTGDEITYSVADDRFAEPSSFITKRLPDTMKRPARSLTTQRFPAREPRLFAPGIRLPGH